VDDKSLGILKQAAANHVGLPVQFSDRLRGSSYDELVQDGKRALKDFGLAEEQPRDARGRFSMSDRIRQAAGHAPAAAPERPVGSVGIGIGGGAQERTREPVSMNALIRGTVSARRGTEWAFAEQLQTDG
jgi:hypothetical protein